MNRDINAQLIDVLPVNNKLGEGVQWHELTESIWWTDIESCCLYRYEVASKRLNKIDMPERVGCFSFIKNEQRICAAFESGIALYNVNSGQIEWLAKPESSVSGNRFNDGRTDRQGRFWAGTMVETPKVNTQRANLYSYDSVNGCQIKLSNIEISNGLCWSPDGSKMYHADSPKQAIYQYDFDSQTGTLSHKALFARTSGNSFPDGSCTDSQGNLWNAQWGGSRVVMYDTNGQKSFEIDIPTTQPSCVAFAGQELDLLVVTSARQNMTQQELMKDQNAGNLFIYQLSGVKGLPENQVIL